MAHGKVVVGTKGNSFEQLIKDEESGFLCESENPESLMETINKVVTLDDFQRKNIGERAKKRITKLRPEKVVTQLLSYYKEQRRILLNGLAKTPLRGKES